MKYTVVNDNPFKNSNGMRRNCNNNISLLINEFMSEGYECIKIDHSDYTQAAHLLYSLKQNLKANQILTVEAHILQGEVYLVQSMLVDRSKFKRGYSRRK